jgi:hypothetical protein
LEVREWPPCGPPSAAVRWGCQAPLGLELGVLNHCRAPLVVSGPDGRPSVSREMLALVRAGYSYHIKCTNCSPAPCFVRVAETAPNAPNSPVYFSVTSIASPQIPPKRLQGKNGEEDNAWALAVWCLVVCSLRLALVRAGYRNHTKCHLSGHLRLPACVAWARFRGGGGAVLAWRFAARGARCNPWPCHRVKVSFLEHHV